MKRLPLNERLIAGLEEALANVKLDEKNDLSNEPTDTSENPDEKTRSKNKKSKAVDDPEETIQENIEMTKASIRSIVKHANALMMGLNEANQTGLSEGWVQSKITIIEDYLKAVHDYVMYYEEEEEDD